LPVTGDAVAAFPAPRGFQAIIIIDLVRTRLHDKPAAPPGSMIRTHSPRLILPAGLAGAATGY